MLWNTHQNCPPSVLLTHTIFEHNKMVVLWHFHLVGLYTVIMGTSIPFHVLLRGCASLRGSRYGFWPNAFHFLLQKYISLTKCILSQNIMILLMMVSAVCLFLRPSRGARPCSMVFWILPGILKL